MDNPKAVVHQTKKYGKAVFALKSIKKGEEIASFDGQICDNNFDGWTDDLRNHAIQIGKNRWRDSFGIARYINHSCDPNCGIKGLYKVVAMRDIEKGEELTWDYEMTEKNTWWRMKCKCGSSLCRKVIGNYSRMPKKIREKYKGYISKWIVDSEKRKKRKKRKTTK